MRLLWLVASDPSGGGTSLPWGPVWTPDVQVGSQLPQGVSRQRRDEAPPEGAAETEGAPPGGLRARGPFWALGEELETWASGAASPCVEGLHPTPLPGGVPAAGLGLLGEPALVSPAPIRLLGLPRLFLVAAAIRAQDTGWPGSSSH